MTYIAKLSNEDLLELRDELQTAVEGFKTSKSRLDKHFLMLVLWMLEDVETEILLRSFDS